MTEVDVPLRLFSLLRQMDAEATTISDSGNPTGGLASSHVIYPTEANRYNFWSSHSTRSPVALRRKYLIISLTCGPVNEA